MWVCLAENYSGQAIVNLSPTSLVMFDGQPGENGSSKIEAICSNNVCFGEHISTEDSVQYIIMNIDYKGDKPSAILATGVTIKNKQAVKIYSEPTKIQFTECTKF
jgi:hypothetical protein